MTPALFEAANAVSAGVSAYAGVAAEGCNGGVIAARTIIDLCEVNTQLN